MFFWRNKLPQFACSNLTTQATSRTSISQERSGISTGSDGFGRGNETLRFLTSGSNRSSTIDRLHYLESLNHQSRNWTEKDKIHHCLSPDPRTPKQKEGKDGAMVLSTSDYWNEASRLQDSTRLHENTEKTNSSASDFASVPDTIPLDVLFTICSGKHGWLTIQDKKVNFLHSSDGDETEEPVKFVVGCYLAYLGDTSSDKSPISTRAPSEGHWRVNNKAFVGPQHPESQLSQIMYSIGMDTNQITNYGGPAHKRYAQYFLSILYTSNPPLTQPAALRVAKVVVSGLEQIRKNLRINRALSNKWRDSVLHPVLVIYQKGKLKWKKIVPIKDSIFEFSPEVDVVGDAVVGIWFVKDCVSTNDPPVVAFSFHSSFMEAGVVRLASADLSLLEVDIEGLLENPPTTISMELTLSQSRTPVEEVENWIPVLESNPVHTQWLTEKKGLPEIYATLTQSQSKEIGDKDTPLKEQQIKDLAPDRSPEKKSKTQDKSPQKSPTRAPGSRKAPPPPPPKRKPSRRLSSSSYFTSKNKPVSKTKPLYWSITPKQSGTVWSELTPADSVDETRLNLLEDLFCKDEASKQKNMETEKSKTNQKKGTALAVSIGRANNISIMMTRFKRFNNKVDDLCKAILTGQDVSLEELVLLSQIGPTEMETRDLKEHNQEALSIPEQVLLAMSVVPRLRVKASCRVAMETWENHYSEAVNMLETVKASCRQLRESQRLRRVLASVLSVGNAMNKGTSRGNAGGLKIESLSKLWDTKVSKNAMIKDSKTKTKLHRAGTVPTVISQCLEEKEVQNKINSLLDFIAVLVRDNDQKRGLTPCDDYLLVELESLQESVAYLEDGIGDLLSEVEKGFSLLEREFLDMTGKSWISVDCTRPDSVHDLTIKNCEVFLEEQYTFLKSSFDFLIMAGGARTFLKQEVNVSDQYLKSTVQWLGEENSGSPKLHLRQLLEFAQQFDISYKKLKT